MGCSQSSAAPENVPDPKEVAQNQNIDQEMRSDLEKESQQIKLLLLGPGDSGKTTLRKQMRNLFGSGFTTEMRQEFVAIILHLLVSGFGDVLEAMRDVFKSKVAPSCEGPALSTLDLAKSPGKVILDADIVKDLNALLNDPNFKAAVAQRSLFQLQDCWIKFAEELRDYPSWGGTKWVPSIDDCVACRVRTSGIQEEPFTLDGMSFRVFDVGGQRAERRKWINCFDQVTAIIFVAAISEYDQNLFEDRTKNRLEEAVEVFEEVCNNKLFENVDMILFLNKKDLFEKKFIVEGVPIDQAKFPGAPKDRDSKTAFKYFENLFVSKNKFQKLIHVYVTAATDSDNVKNVFQACKNIILKNSMKASGFA